MKWIKTTDPQRPKDGQRIVVAWKNDSLQFAGVYHSDFDRVHIQDGGTSLTVFDYWLPIPELPTEEQT